MALAGRPSVWFYYRTLISPKARQVMTDDLESVALRSTVIDGQRQEDDYEVIWRGLPIGGYSLRIQSLDLRQYRQTTMPGSVG
jgi:hypothetical protein